LRSRDAEQVQHNDKNTENNNNNKDDTRHDRDHQPNDKLQITLCIISSLDAACEELIQSRDAEQVHTNDTDKDKKNHNNAKDDTRVDAAQWLLAPDASGWLLGGTPP